MVRTRVICIVLTHTSICTNTYVFIDFNRAEGARNKKEDGVEGASEKMRQRREKKKNCAEGEGKYRPVTIDTTLPAPQA